MFKKLIRALRLRSSFAAMFLAASAMLGISATAAHAEFSNPNDGQVEHVDAFTPGMWHTLGSPLDPNRPSLAALLKVEAETGAIFCKVKERDGRWRSNLVDCGERGLDTNRIDLAASPGIMMPGTNNFFRTIFEYGMAATRHDRNLAAKLRAAQQYIVARASDPAVVATLNARDQQPAVRTQNVRVAVVEPTPRRVVPPEVLARLGAAKADLTATPNEDGRFVRGGDVFELRKTPDGSSMYAFSYDPYADTWRPAYNASLRDNGAAKLTNLTGSVDAGTLVAFNYVPIENQPGVIVVAADTRFDATFDAAQPYSFIPGLNGMSVDLRGAMPEEGTLRADAFQVIPPFFNPDDYYRIPALSVASNEAVWPEILSAKKEEPQTRLASLAGPVFADLLGAIRPALADDTPLDENKPAREPVKAPDRKRSDAADRVVVLPNHAKLSKREAGDSPKKAFARQAIVRRQVQGTRCVNEYLRVVTHQGEMIDIATQDKHVDGTRIAYIYKTDAQGQRVRRIFDLASSPEIGAAANNLLLARAANTADAPRYAAA